MGRKESNKQTKVRMGILVQPVPDVKNNKKTKHGPVTTLLSALYFAYALRKPQAIGTQIKRAHG